MTHPVLLVIFYLSVAVVVGSVVLVLATELGEVAKRKWERHRGLDLAYERYAAERAIRAIERRTVQELLAAYHREKPGGEDVIEGKCVEVRQ